MGSKYKFVPKEGPPPGLYDATDSLTKPKSQSVLIKEDTHPYRRPQEQSPDPGLYDGHLKPFGSEAKNNATMGSKYKFVPKEGPPPGLYEPNGDAIKPRVQSAVIKEETHPYRRPQEQSPEPGKYDGHLKPFGSDLKNTSTMGSKYKFVPKEGPPPGLYEPKGDAIKPRVPSAVIKEETSPGRRPAEITPDPGSYEPPSKYQFG